MSKVIRKLRNLKPHHRGNKMYKKGPSMIPNTEAGQTFVIDQIVHERGRAAPLVVLKHGEKSTRSYLVAVEGNYVGQKIEVGSGVPFKLGNCLPLREIPESTAITAVEMRPGDGGRLGRASGSFSTIISHNRDANTTTIKLPSGVKKVVSSDVKAVIGIVAGGGVSDKPLLKAGAAYYKYKAKNIAWPKVSGVAMNPVDHPHGGGNHQHIGHPSTISRHAPPGQKVGLIAARRTGYRKGKKREVAK
ncbi:60S ribosomal protein L8 [Astathelohania contejeani]|uniref:60S ribosomal protein L8 n=1 Tax=Astathelohania contejeani TaxID=164912 RepID=A0ABQ7HXP8_9MICR|nr:60S ribosomal protein L8 [Thelohania contejeani]